MHYDQLNFDMGMTSHSKTAAFVPIRSEQVSTNIHTAHLFALQNECFEIDSYGASFRGWLSSPKLVTHPFILCGCDSNVTPIL